MSELKPCPFCGYEPETRKVIVYPNGEKSPAFIRCKRCNYHLFGYDYEALVAHWNCRPIENALKDELKATDALLKEATETIGAVVACCTYNSNDDAKIGVYGIDQNAFTRIDQFITHYNDAVSDGKVSVEVNKQFCPNCEAETPCTHEAELFVCDICGEDFAKYIVSRNANVSDVSMTQDVLTDIKTPQSIENNNPDYYKQELACRDEIIARLIALGDALIANEAVFASQEQAEHYTVVINEWNDLKGMAE